MWCLVYIAISATTVPPTDCSLTSLELCAAMAAIVNMDKWDDNLEAIPYLAKCMSTSDRQKYLRVQMINRVLVTK